MQILNDRQQLQLQQLNDTKSQLQNELKASNKKLLSETTRAENLTDELKTTCAHLKQVEG